MPEVKSVQPFSEQNKESTYLLLISPDKIPHLVLVQDDKYYSLTHKKSVIAADFRPYLSFLKKSDRKVLFIEINDRINDLKKVFETYKTADNESITCLQPVNNCLLPGEKFNFVFELIPALYECNMIVEVFQLNMDEDIDPQGNYELSVYSKKDIYSYIDKLNRKYV